MPHLRFDHLGEKTSEAYRNKKHFFNVQVICDANLKIFNILARWPRSSHNSSILSYSTICGKSERGEIKDCLLIEDSGYDKRNFVMTIVANS